MTKQLLDFSGVFPPVPTPFDEEGEVAPVKLLANMRIWNQFQLRGFVVLGSNGEAPLLSPDERIAVLSAAREGIPPDRLFIAGTGGQSTKETVELSRRAQAIGVDAVLVLPPSYYRPRMTRQALVRHYSTVADAVEVPLLVYNMPACTGIDLDAETVAAIAQHPNVIGIKDSSGNTAKIAEMRTLLGPSFQILAGSASFFLPALSVGAVGGVLALANIAPQACIDIRKAFLAGDMRTATEIQVRMVPANTAVTSGGGVAALKLALDLLHLYGGPVRAPLLGLDPAGSTALRETLARAGIGRMCQ